MYSMIDFYNKPCLTIVCCTNTFFSKACGWIPGTWGYSRGQRFTRCRWGHRGQTAHGYKSKPGQYLLFNFIFWSASQRVWCFHVQYVTVCMNELSKSEFRFWLPYRIFFFLRERILRVFAHRALPPLQSSVYVNWYKYGMWNCLICLHCSVCVFAGVLYQWNFECKMVTLALLDKKSSWNFFPLPVGIFTLI